jgi:uncharacterized protein involved in exopolysaccharide biosynthesis
MAERINPEPSFGDYLQIFKRRAKVLALVTGTVILIGIGIAYRTPPIYESNGVLLAEQPGVPEHIVRSTVPDYPEERVRIITQRVLTNENLENIIAARGLYPELAATPNAALREFRDHLALSSEDPEILENIMGTQRAANAMAFSVTFFDRSPTRARDVTSDVVSLYLEENQRARREQAAETTRFLTQEANRLDQMIAVREEQLAEFKGANAGSLPELANMNLQLLDRVERDLEAVEQEILSLRQQQALYSSELAQLSPQATIVSEEGTAVLGSQDRLKLLQRRYVQMTAVYSQDHPDVLAIRREIDALSASTGTPAFDQSTLQAELTAREDQLAAARERYSPDHPDVRRLERTVATLRETATAASTQAPPSLSPTVPDNPEYIQRQVQLQATSAELDAAFARREQLRSRLTDLESRLSATPVVEREFSTLSRGYQQLLSQYNEVQQKLSESEIALNLETENNGERFTLLNAPGVPTSPAQPNRLAVLLLTFAAAVVLGAASVAVAERADRTVRNRNDVLKHLEIPPLVSIPFVYNQADLRRRSWNRLVATSAACAWLATVMFLVMNPAG